ncbi:GPO family capsid scaffolding protein [Vibrio crassostreae]|uniref:GPO family capsid scaffolding protein n=1 Tax=Vibrio crassostreae TaxID=246167 RepID=UPI001B30BE2A|nr:GPO family capsid scaffolding protein [Vibrio crassostreae]CAK1707797.1 Phage capsid protein [Vibrio crassostreae]CAK2384461.1 Phage capsid protein [Vibrio crassostreae]CAK2444961.1 Phage capsid protein [Vibrio crassostreae]CAK2555341.1 Phage capsid protein [Vibrio crassostreae]CAK2561629.1 Phage capsid protein [Vibrio crassostreae]
MFQSELICILQAGATIDGRVIEQKIIDEIAETYNPEVYTARINADHYPWSSKYGSVLSVEKKEDKLFAVLKPNSMLLRMAEQGQLLHTSCEFYEKFADTGKAYLTGLALTDEPASLGTTQIQLSANSKDKACVPTNFQITPEQLSQSTEEEASMFNTFKRWLKGESELEQLSQQQEEDDMSKELEELLKQSIEQGKENQQQLSQLNEQVEKLNTNGKPPEHPAEPEESTDVTELKDQVETLSSQVENLTGQIEKFSKLTDEEQRKLAGEGNDEERYL